MGEELVKRLGLEDQDAITVRIGSEFTKLSDRLYTLNPRQRHDYEILLNELLTQNKFPKTIVHLWSLTPVARIELELERVDKSQEAGFYSLLFLVQALGKQNFTDELQIAVISNNMQDVAGEELLCPEKATLLGPVRVIPQEYPNISCRSIDVVIPKEANWIKQNFIDQLLVELQVHTSDRVIAYRGFHRWVQNFEPVRLDEAKEETPRLRERGVYLITGGLGGIGLVLAEHLALTVRAKLILTGRSAFPAKDEWEQWLTTHDEQDIISCKIRKVLELEELGAEILVISADVTNSEQMQQEITQAQEQFGQLNGVIHAAGVPGGGVIQRKTPEMAENILAPKVKGTLVLNSILKDNQLDFFVLCSARTGILGGFGQVDYVGANAFLDAFAHHKTHQDGTFTVSIDWSAWQEVGMAAEADQQRVQISDISQTPQFKEVTSPNRFKRKLLKEELLPAEGIEVFRRIIGSTLSQVIVSTYKLQSRDFLIQGKQDNGFQTKSYPKVLETTNLSKPTQQRPSLINPYVAPRNNTEQTLADIWQELLGIEAIGINDNFFELGGDSLLIVQIRSQLQKRLNIDISISDSFEYPTISVLAEYLSKKQVEQPVIQQFHKIERAKRSNAKDILAKVNKISDQQVDSLLKEIQILSKNEFEQ